MSGVAPGDPGAQEPGLNQARSQTGDESATARCDIPLGPVSKDLKTFASVWQEYRHGTESKPSIRQLINDHGSEWQKPEYLYDRKVWWKKKKVVSAVYAVRHIQSLSATEALKQLEETRLATPKTKGHGHMGVHEFIEKFLPNLNDKVDVSGKCKQSAHGGWRPITVHDPQFAVWQAYLGEIRNKFNVDTALV
ncbi:hypothetical protein MMC16_007862 [Acarospora aff. strigata]|nr:hypothetical protein [Acarospora aff. strigata]